MSKAEKEWVTVKTGKSSCAVSCISVKEAHESVEKLSKKADAFSPTRSVMCRGRDNTHEITKKLLQDSDNERLIRLHFLI